ncbi:MAG TPA: methyltransferase, partial [Rhizomicrobium sp.]|nr:methyltransferase [Rhizomicrobium sp.]
MAVNADEFLGGRILVRQPERGFRSGLDAVMLAAAVPAQAGHRVLELGSGAGVASLCLASRVSACDVTGAEIDPVLVQLGNENSAGNRLADRVRFVAADIADLPGGLRREFDHVFCNPPFHGDDGERS